MKERWAGNHLKTNRLFKAMGESLESPRHPYPWVQTKKVTSLWCNQNNSFIFPPGQKSASKVTVTMSWAREEADTSVSQTQLCTVTSALLAARSLIENPETKGDHRLPLSSPGPQASLNGRWGLCFFSCSSFPSLSPLRVSSLPWQVL